MRTPIKWLQQYIDINLDHEDLFDRLTMAGMEVEKVDEVAGDIVFEIEVTPNRPDCLSVFGIAREVSAVTDQDTRFPVPQEYVLKNNVDITIEDPQGCARYIGMIIRDVTIGSTPDVMAGYLRSLDMSGVNNVVDITNFSLHENGQPLHAFDLDKLAGGKIIVRRAQKGETLVALDDNTYDLDEEVLVIADAEKPVAIAGIMGGKATGVTAGTKNILLESAYFDPGLIRRTSRKLGLSSDSCYRFERGVHWHGVDYGASRAADLIVDIAGGSVDAKTDIIANKPQHKASVIKLSSAKIESVLGSFIPPERVETILKRLGCAVYRKEDEYKITPPTQRTDLTIAEDIIEEVARVIGYDQLSSSLPLIKAANVAIDHGRVDIKKVLNETLRGFGYSEIIPFSMTNQTALEHCFQAEMPRITIRNPLSLDQEALRPSMLPSFMNIFQTNVHRGQPDLRLFEIGKIYPPGQQEKSMLGVLLSGQRRNDWRDGQSSCVDFYDLKGVVDQVLNVLCIDHVVYEHADYPGLSSGQTAAIKKEDAILGYMGTVPTDVLSNWGVKKGVVYFAELDINAIDQYRGLSRKLSVISEYPSMTRDIALSIKTEYNYDQVKAVCFNKGQSLLKDIAFIELYMGKTVPKGYRGLTISLRYQSNERTLTDDDVSPIHESIRQELEAQLEVLYR